MLGKQTPALIRTGRVGAEVSEYGQLGLVEDGVGSVVVADDGGGEGFGREHVGDAGAGVGSGGHCGGFLRGVGDGLCLVVVD